MTDLSHQPANVSAVPAAADYEVPTPRRARGWERRVRRLLTVPEVGIALVVIALLVLFYFINPSILRPGSLRAMLRAMSFIGIIAIGQTMLLVAGELDISVGSVLGLCQIVGGYLMVQHGWPVPLAVLAALACGAAIGLVNGLLAVVVGIPAFIVTLGMLYVARGFTYLICGGYPISKLPHSVNAFGLAYPLDLSWAFWIFIVLAVGFQVMLGRTVWGRAIYATGGNAEVARIAGIRTKRVKILCYVATSTLAALSGLLLMAQFNTAQPEFGQGYELEVIASVVIGGVSLFGGMGSITAAVLGLLLMQVVRSGMVLSGVNTHWQTVATGGIMVAAVAIDLLRRRARIME